MPSAAEVQSPNHWTATECPRGRILTHVYLLLNFTGFFYSSFSKIQDKSPFFFFWTGRLKTLKSKITFPLRFSSYSSTFDNKLMVRFMLSAINSFKIYLNFNLRKTKNVLIFLQDFQNLHCPTRITPRSMVVKVQSPNNCITREFSVTVLIKSLF